MTGGGDGEDPRELRLYGKVRRRLAIGVFGLLALDIVVDAVNPTFEPSPYVFFGLIGLLAALVGLDILRFPEDWFRRRG